MAKKSKLIDERMIDSICTSNEKLQIVISEIIRRIKQERLRQKYSVPELALLSGISTSVLYRMEQGTANIGLTCLLKLMWCLNISPDKIIPYDAGNHQKKFGDVIEELTHEFTPVQKQYLLKTIKADIELLKLDSKSVKPYTEYSNSISISKLEANSNSKNQTR